MIIAQDVVIERNRNEQLSLLFHAEWPKSSQSIQRNSGTGLRAVLENGC